MTLIFFQAPPRNLKKRIKVIVNTYSAAHPQAIGFAVEHISHHHQEHCKSQAFKCPLHAAGNSKASVESMPR